MSDRSRDSGHDGGRDSRPGHKRGDGDNERLTGVLQMHPSGRGFVDIGEAYEDLVVDRGDVGAAMDGDTVEVEAWQGRTRRMARVVQIVTRGRTRLTGVLEGGGGGKPQRLRPDDPRILQRVELEPELEPERSAKAGQAVLVLITRYPGGSGEPLGARLERVLGEPGLLLTEVDTCLAGRGVQTSFPPAAQEAAATMPAWVRAEDKADRLDLRDRHFVTIDPLNARDFDDAVAIEEGPGETTRVWVAVADVSHYVHEGSVLDTEARGRGCSVYLPDRAIPMLPPKLSAEICSLVPQRDRLAMVVRLDVAPNGRIVEHGCAAAVIHSRGQLDYSGVAAALDGDFAGKRSAYREHSDLLGQLSSVATALRRRRLRRGALDLDLPEAQIVLDQDDPNRVRQVVQSRPDTPIKRAYGLVEELMIAANEAVGREFSRADEPTIWRIHPPPRADALDKLAAWMGAYGIKVSPEELADERGMGQLVKQLQRHRAARPLSYLVLRTLKQATYAPVNAGHFGLASKTYLHFTSPIRRYPDLCVHRLLKAMLRRAGTPAGQPATQSPPDMDTLRGLCREASANERLAIDVEREVQRVYAASLMRDKIGEEASGLISGITSFGFFVSLEDPFVEGLVKAETLPRGLDFDGDALRLFAPGGQVFSLGDRVHVKVTDTSVRKRQIDLELCEGPSAHEQDPGAPRPGQGGRRDRRDGHERGRKGKRQFRRPGGGGPADKRRTKRRTRR
jgi:ribonuclease R